MRTIFNCISRVITRSILLAVCCLIVLASTGMLETPQPTVIREVIPAELPEPPTMEQLLETVAPKYGVNPVLVRAIIHQESGGKRDAIRFEPGQMARAKKVTGLSNESEIRQYASSHCPMQVMGYHAPRYNLSWVDLYQPENCIEVGTAILADCLHRQKGSKYKRIHGALACYNGSTTYADQVMGRIAQELVEQYL